jgi:hemerythrin-like domain-containing protein
MGVTELLTQDHKFLRAELRLLEAAMRMGPEAPFVLREMCASLASMLEDHIWHEAEALRPYCDRIEAFRRERMAREHADQQIVLRDVNTLLLGGMNAPVNRVAPSLTQLMEELREHMDEEERELFPLVDRISAERYGEVSC